MVRPSEDTPNGGTHVLAVCAPLGQLNYFVALALQQHGEQSALRKGRGHNVVSFCFSCPKDGQFSQGFRSFLRQVPYKSRRAFAREGHTPRTRSASAWTAADLPVTLQPVIQCTWMQGEDAVPSTRQLSNPPGFRAAFPRRVFGKRDRHAKGPRQDQALTVPA